MGLLGDIGDVIIGGVLGGPAGAIAVFTIEHGPEVVEGTVDLTNQIVEIGTDVYRAVPPEVFVFTGDPIHGLLKHEAEDELIMLGHIAGDLVIYGGVTWSAVGPFGAAAHLYVTGKLLSGKLDHRPPNAQEWEMAQYIFGDSLPGRTDVILTNLAGLEGRPFTYPLAPAGRPVMVNLAGYYDQDSAIPRGPTLFHELTHVWQAERRLLREIFFYDAHVLLTEGDEAYFFKPDGRQWADYNIEEQASIVEAWTLGATERTASHPEEDHYFDVGVREPLALASPLFRYVNGNVRRADSRRSTQSGRSVRQLLADGGHATVKRMHPEPPQVWW
jgi:hypothetical protein